MASWTICPHDPIILLSNISSINGGWKILWPLKDTFIIYILPSSCLIQVLHKSEQFDNQNRKTL
ncbi:hypothetical protein Leryth_008737 [Lithospermum erythrorhizon]|nr:hypothetical protein Leryth_008737 [Lithospermum erythrorhizon]